MSAGRSERLVILARHASHDEVGRVLSGRSAIPLNARGRAEAAALALAVAADPPRTLHASPRARTIETAAAIAGRTGLAPRIAPALDEIDFGAFAGRGFDALEEDAAWRHWNAARDEARCPGGETMAEVVARAAAFLAGLRAEDCPALCVTHCDVIRGLVVRARGQAFDAMFAVACEPASRTVLSIGDGGAMRVVTLNQSPT